jgi:hypothetical protein
LKKLGNLTTPLLCDCKSFILRKINKFATFQCGVPAFGVHLWHSAVKARVSIVPNVEIAGIGKKIS